MAFLLSWHIRVESAFLVPHSASAHVAVKRLVAIAGLPDGNHSGKSRM